MDKTIEKEFSIGDLLNLTVTRNDFDKLGNVLEFKFTPIIPTNHILIMSFYNEEKNQISQKNLKIRCNYKNILFDNILLISNLKINSLNDNNNNQEYKLKFLNKNIYYMKFYIQTFNILNQSEYSFSQVFNLKQMKILSKEEMKDLSLNNDINNSMGESVGNKNKNEKNNNLNLIISELDKINRNLAERQKELDQKEKDLKKQENYINKQKKIIEQKIVQFKEEVLLFGDKCYGECVNEINNKMQKLNKKITQVENNVINKYRILKDKLNTNKQNIAGNMNNLISQEKKDKIANLEIKIKFLEDSLSKLKEKNAENEEKIKNYVNNEEKLNNTIKKLKDELILTNSQIKDKEKKNKINNISSNMSISNISYVDNKDNISLASMLSKVKNKKKSNVISFEIDKHQKEIISKYFVYNFILEYKIKPNNSIDKEILTASILLMHLSTNPIELYNKFELGHIIILHKLIFNIYLNNVSSYQVLIKEGLNDLYNKLPEFKNNISVFVSNNKRRYFEFNPLVELNIILASSIVDKTGNNSIINEINFSNIIFNKCVSFNNFISKNNYNISKISSNNNINNERKNKIKKFTIISNLVLSILFCSTIQELLSILKQIITYFSNSNRDKEIINFLIKIKFGKILLLIFQKISNSEIYSDKIGNNDKDIKELIQYIIDCILYIMANMNIINNNEQVEINNNLDINLEKDIGFILLENKFIDYIKSNINDYLKYYNEIKNNPLNNFVPIDQNYYDIIRNTFLKNIILITNLSIYCSNLRIKIKEIFMDNIINIQNIFKNNEKKDKNKKEDKYISFINKNISLLSKLLI